VPSSLPQKVLDQIQKAGLPSNGTFPYSPALTANKKGELIIEKRAVSRGPKRGKRGYLDEQGRIWVMDRAHAGLPDHWDVQINGGESYIRVDQTGAQIP
jgi:hypothetical protein